MEPELPRDPETSAASPTPVEAPRTAAPTAAPIINVNPDAGILMDRGLDFDPAPGADLAFDKARAAHQLHEGEKVERAITILKPVSEVFAFWRDFSNLPKFMSHLESVEVLSPVRSHWRYRTMGGLEFEWDSEIIAEIQDRMISWQTTPDSELLQAGSVWFRPAPQDGATEIHLQLRYKPPGGRLARTLGTKLAELFGEEPSQIMRSDLLRLRWLLEAGEIPTTEGQPHGVRGLLH